jgi:hypothetical protein
MQLQRLSAQQGQRAQPARPSRAVAQIRCVAKPTGKGAKQQAEAKSALNTLGAAATGLLLPYIAEVGAALAKDGEYGILEGRSFALIHPIVMGSLFLGTGYAGYLGWQWRRVRELADEIKGLKKQIPAPKEGEAPVVSPLQSQIEALEKVRAARRHRLHLLRSPRRRRLGGAPARSAGGEHPGATGAAKLPGPSAGAAGSRPAAPCCCSAAPRSGRARGRARAPPAASPLTHQARPPARPPAPQERKELLGANVRDKHWWMGNLLLASGTGIAIAGCANTFMRTGRLFPGPHLFAGAGIVGLWALAAALVPEMQKGNQTARSAHIALNAVNFALFAWQVPTGLEIVGKVFQFTSWP